MRRARGWLLALAIAGLAAAAAAAASLPGSASGVGSWGGGGAGTAYRLPFAQQQNLQTVLVSIEERLRALDSLYSARYAPRLDLAADQHARRLDGIEARLGRLETLLELRLDKLAETLSARQLKEELAKDQMSRSLDATFERLSHRMGYMETRLEVAVTKLQSSVETLSGRVERLEMGLGGRHGDMGAELDDMKSRLDELRRSVQGSHQSLLNSTLHAAAAGEGALQRYYERLSGALDRMQSELNRSLTVQNDGGGSAAGGGGSSDGPLRHERHVAGSLLSAVDRHASGITSKVTNMYNELWRRTQILEGLSKDSMALSNATRRELQEGLRSISMQLGRYCSLQADKAKPSSLTLENFEGTLAEMNHKMAYYFQTLISTQHVFLETCHRIQESEPGFEKYLAQVLERMVDLITNNKCQNEVEEVHELLKSHHSTVVRNVGHSTNTVMRAADNSSKEARNLANAINSVQNGLLATTKDIQNSISSMHEGQISVHQALARISGTMKEFQEQLSELSSPNILQETYEHPACPDSKTIAEDIASEMKRLMEIGSHITHNAELKELTVKLTHLLESVESQLSQNRRTTDSLYTEFQTVTQPQILEKLIDEGSIDNINNIDVENNKSFVSINANNVLEGRNKDNQTYSRNSGQINNQIQIEENTLLGNKSFEDPNSAGVTIKLIHSSHQSHHTSDHGNTPNQSPSRINDLGVIHNSNAQEAGSLITIVHDDKPMILSHVRYSAQPDNEKLKMLLNTNITPRKVGNITTSSNLHLPISLNASKPNQSHSIIPTHNNRTSSIDKTEPPSSVPSDFFSIFNSSRIELHKGINKTILENQTHVNITQNGYSDKEIQHQLSRLKGNHTYNLENYNSSSGNQLIPVSFSNNTVKSKNVSSNRTDVAQNPPQDILTSRKYYVDIESNKNEAELTIHQLLHKLEELAKRLVDSEEITEGQDDSHSDYSEEDEEEYSTAQHPQNTYLVN